MSLEVKVSFENNITQIRQGVWVIVENRMWRVHYSFYFVHGQLVQSSFLINLLPISSNVPFSDHLGKAVLTVPL